MNLNHENDLKSLSPKEEWQTILSVSLFLLMLGTKVESEFINIFKVRKLTKINSYLTSFFNLLSSLNLEGKIN